MARRRRRKDSAFATLVAFCLVAAIVAILIGFSLLVLLCTFAYDLARSSALWLRERRPFEFPATAEAWERCRRHLGFVRPPEVRVRTLLDLLTLTPTEFELAVATLLRDLGYRGVERVGRAGDLALDLKARDGKGRSVAVQCKRYRPGNRVGSPDLQRFIGMARAHHGAQRAIFVTTSDFTRQAQTLAQQHKIELIDGNELARLLVRVESSRNRSNAQRPARPVTAVDKTTQGTSVSLEHDNARWDAAEAATQGLTGAKLVAAAEHERQRRLSRSRRSTD